MATARLTAWLVLVGLGALARAAPPDVYVVITTVLATAVAAVALGNTVASVWRGPPLIAFAPEDGLWCGEEDSEPVRAYAQLRGTIGGAGHVHPRRLVLPLIAWAAAIFAGARPLFWPDLEVVGAVPAALAASGAFLTWLFPSRPYWYREVMGGGAMVCPPEAIAALVARERAEAGPALAAIHETGRADPLLRTPTPEASFLRRLTPWPARRDRPNRSAGPLDAAAPPVRGAALDAVRRRPPRYALERTIIVQQDGFELEVAVLNVSDGGLAVRWPGELPIVGDDVVVKIEDGYFLRELEAEVRWGAGDGGGRARERAVGLKVAPDGKARRVWRELVQGAKSRVPSA
jgi:hypothetical protein